MICGGGSGCAGRAHTGDGNERGDEGGLMDRAGVWVFGCGDSSLYHRRHGDSKLPGRLRLRSCATIKEERSDSRGVPWVLPSCFPTHQPSFHAVARRFPVFVCWKTFAVIGEAVGKPFHDPLINTRSAAF